MTAERCCASMTDALAWHMLAVLDGEVVLAARPLTEVNPDATAGNVLTGETYDPSSFAVTLAVEFCPWCGFRLNDEEDERGCDRNSWCVLPGHHEGGCLPTGAE